MNNVTVGYRGKIVTFQTTSAGDVLEQAYAALDTFLANFAAALVGSRLGDYDMDDWDIIAKSVARNETALMFAAKPCGSRNAATFFVTR
jgi:hypothetical protein